MDIFRRTIKFYQKRTFSEKLSATFDFMKESPKELFKLCLYLLLPVALVQAIFMNTYMGSYLSFIENSASYDIAPTEIIGGIAPMMGNLFLMSIVSLIGYALLSSVVYSSVQEYNARGSIKGITFTELKPSIIKNAKRALIASLVISLIMFGIILIMILLAFASPFTLLFTFIVFFALMIPLTLIAPVYIFENSSIGTAVSKGLRLGFKTWGSLFGILFVTGLLAGIVQSFASIPWSLIFFIKGMLSVSEISFDMDGSFLMSIIQYITAVIMLFFSYVASMLILLGTAYHYSSAAEAIDGTSIIEDLGNFEQL